VNLTFAHLTDGGYDAGSCEEGKIGKSERCFPISVVKQLVIMAL
jgi:hypothetical protein